MPSHLPPVFLVTGSRAFPDCTAVEAWAAGLPADAQLVAGGAKGVDTAAATGFLRAHEEAQLTIMRPDWRRGRGAGLARNAAMIHEVCRRAALGHTVTVTGFWDGSSRGTKHCLDEARRAGLSVEVRRA